MKTPRRAVMQRSSECIASLAAALAKAQIELANPEKSLLGSIKSETGNGPERVFRYASLSSGLEIVRKTLGQHEIATVQTTVIDQAAGIINLTTVLAHASGEWIASDWPVCAISETARPHRMGAALTYARRYALFTLVGIAGEDDLDAPDLAAPTAPSPGSGKPGGDTSHRFNGSQPHSDHRRSIRHNGGDITKLAAQTLAPDASAQLRDRLLTELTQLADGDDAALWAQRALPDKNQLTGIDAERIEDAFQGRLANLITMPDNNVSQTTEESKALAAPDVAPKTRRQSRASSIDKSTLALPEPRRIRDRDHVRFVAKQPCLICGRRPADAHHLRYAQSRALGRKVSDEFTVPLCRGHHREVHRRGDEAAWWTAIGVDPAVAARALWLQTHPNLIVSGQTLATAEAPPLFHRAKARRRPRGTGVRANGPGGKTAGVDHGTV